MGKGLNPADAFRKQEKKQAIARDKKQKAAVKEVRVLLGDPDKVDAEIAKVTKELQGNLANKTLKDRLGELQRMKEVALMKRRREDMLKKPDPIPSSSLDPTRRPEESLYYHPQFNPTGAPPPGQRPQYRPSPHALAVTPPVPSHPGIPPPPPVRVTAGAPPQNSYFRPHNIPLGGVGGIPPPPPRAAPASGPQPLIPSWPATQPQRRKAQVNVVD